MWTEDVRVCGDHPIHFQRIVYDEGAIAEYCIGHDVKLIRCPQRLSRPPVIREDFSR